MFEKVETAPPPTDDPRPLFALAIEYYDVSGRVNPYEPIKANIVYTNAENAREAEFMYRAAHSAKFLSGELKLVGVAQPIGWFVQDEHGEVLAG